VLHGVLSNKVNLPVDASAPGVFTINSFGQGNISIRIQARTALSTPLRKAQSLLSMQRAQGRLSQMVMTAA